MLSGQSAGAKVSSAQGPGDGVGGGLHAGHEEDAQLAPQTHKRQRLARAIAHPHQMRPYRTVLLFRPLTPTQMHRLNSNLNLNLNLKYDIAHDGA